MKQNIQESVTIPYDKIDILCRTHSVQKLSLFGSILRDDFRPDSDIDVLIEFEPNAEVTLFDMGGVQFELSELFAREIDLKTPDFLSRYFRERILSEARVIYERR